MANKRLLKKCLAFGISFSIMLGSMTGLAARADQAENAAGQADEETVVISEKSAEAESIAALKKEEKAAEKAAGKAAKEQEKEDKKQEKEEKKAEKEQEKENKKEEKEQQKNTKKLTKEKHEKKSIKSTMKELGEFWNIVSVGSAEAGIRVSNADGSAEPVKVAILDSGVDYTEDIDVYMRRNFIPGEDEISIIYEDLCGHGTSVAGIIAAKDNDEGITGINPGVQLYSARILDENRQAPVSRVVEAIDWAIAQDVDIINISFGTGTDSEAMHAAIRRAYDAGILIVAAAGNNGLVEYPAAYEEVIAVGAVDTDGERAEGSAVGEELELVAPGVQIVSTGAFGGLCVAGGTSMAAPHVTAVASVLWQKDRSVSADFIRSLLAFTANQYGEDYEYGYGLVDLEFALSQYDAFREAYAADDSLDGKVEEAVEDGKLQVNEKPVVEFTDVAYVEGAWATQKHENLVQYNGDKLNNIDIMIIKKGIVIPDSYYSGMKRNSEWHGFERHVTNGSTVHYSNYYYAYLYFMDMACAINRGVSPLGYTGTVQAGCVIEKCSCQNGQCIISMRRAIQSKLRDTGMVYEDKDTGVVTRIVTWSELLNGNLLNDRNKALLFYGFALHTITDAFAHSTYYNGKRIDHDNGADSLDYVPNRYRCAEYFTRRALEHIVLFQAGNVTDINSIMPVYDGSFTMGYLSSYVKAISLTYYNSNYAFLERINAN